MTKAEHAARKAALISYLRRLGGRNKDAKSVARALIKQGIKSGKAGSCGACPVAEGVRQWAIEKYGNDFRSVMVGSRVEVIFYGRYGFIAVDSLDTGMEAIDDFIAVFDSGALNQVCPVSKVLRAA